MIPATGKYERLWGYLKPYWRLELLTLLVMAIVAGLALALPRAMQYMIDVLIPSLTASTATPADRKSILIFAGILLGIYLFNVLFSWIRDYLAGVVGAGIIRDIRLDLFRHLERLPLTFHQDHQVGEIMSRMLNDVFRVQGLLGETLLTLIMNAFVLIAITVYLVNINWLLTLVAVVPVPLTVLASDRYGKQVHSLISVLQEKVALTSAHIQERLLGIKTVKAFGQEEREAERLDATLKVIRGLSVKNSVLMSLAANSIQFVNMIGPIIVLAWGVYLVAAGSMKLGELIAFYILLTYLYAPIQSLAQSNVQIQSAMASFERINEYLEIPTDVVDSANPTDPTVVKGMLEFKQVSFSYGTPSFQLKDLTFTVGARHKVAIVGPSGSGKTTIVNLLMRFYDPESGTILLDNRDIRTLSVGLLRRSIALVDQDPILFHGTVRDNISYGEVSATRDQIEAAARIANIHDYICSLPNGYETQIGERGVTVSGGEKQRLCLARAVLRNPSILILDEATSALDANSEQLIQQSLEKILAEKTAIIIAHRLATVKHVDEIIVIDHGGIVDHGTHEVLVNQCALYRELAQKQLLA